MNKTFILTNDPDHGTLHRLKMVFEALNKYNILVTTAAFCTLGRDGSLLSRHCHRGETGVLDEPEYKDFLLEQRENGHEIAFHGYSQLSNTREQFEEGLEWYKTLFGEYPFSYFEHGGTPLHHRPDGCKKERLDWYGSDKTSDYYVKDIVRDKIMCVWANYDLLDGVDSILRKGRCPTFRGKPDNLTPKTTSQLFYKEDGILFFRRWRMLYLDTVSQALKRAEDAVFIGYTHFGYDGHATQHPIEDWRSPERCDRTCRAIREIIDAGGMQNKTLKMHVLDNFIGQKNEPKKKK